MRTDRKLKIIIADDHKFFRAGLEAVLKSFGYVESVTQAENGKQLIDLMEKESYHIAFVDISMPEMNGIDAVTIIAQRHPKVKALALSMHDDQDNILEMMKAGASGFILKNTDKDEIDEAIKIVLDGKHYFSNGVSDVLYQQLVSKTKSPIQKQEEDILSKERFREIIFLLCHEFKNAEIGEILFLATSTIETYRKDAIQELGCKSTAGLIKYGVESGLYKDPVLFEKFKKVIGEKAEEE
ncbi:MAG: response regulator transcription factor [Bacteroidetes bacterium]|nr:MAG: response regulator transcription factor [Bacteroidota bacterium]